LGFADCFRFDVEEEGSVSGDKALVAFLAFCGPYVRGAGTGLGSVAFSIKISMGTL
jgi:hypothetical protein